MYIIIDIIIIIKFITLDKNLYNKKKLFLFHYHFYIFHLHQNKFFPCIHYI